MSGAIPLTDGAALDTADAFTFLSFGGRLHITDMNDVKLLTRTGDYVTTVLVPPFDPPAEVILWGERAFVLASGEYREGVAWVCHGAGAGQAISQGP